MGYNVACGCGKELAVTAGEAGSQKHCTCGRTVKVPTLGQLARAAGNPLATLSATERVSYLVSSGELPAGAVCARCQFPTDATLHCSVECERPYVREHGSWWTTFFSMLIFGFVRTILVQSRENPEVHGRELIVKMPLRMCPDCQPLFQAGSRVSELRNLLRSVSEYEAVLATYPQASVAAMPQCASR